MTHQPVAAAHVDRTLPRVLTTDFVGLFVTLVVIVGVVVVVVLPELTSPLRFILLLVAAGLDVRLLRVWALNRSA